MRELIFGAFMSGAFSWLYHVILREQILSDWFLWGWKRFGNFQGKKKWYVEIWYKPIFECEVCLSGHLAFWSYFFHFDYYFLYAHLVYVTLSMLFAKLIVKWTKSEV